MSYNIHNGKRSKYFMSESIFPQTIDVVQTKCHAIGIELEIGKVDDFDWDRASEYAGILV
jgi:glycine cleavage system pyridoxal-binding protein P